MKKFLVSCCLLCSILTLIGCQNFKTGKPELVPQVLSEKEEYLLNLTGNKVLLYSLKNLPTHDNYQLSLTYEVYENGEKVKDDSIISMIKNHPSMEVFPETIGINFRENEIRYIAGVGLSYSWGSLEIEEDLMQYSQAFFGNQLNFPLGTEVYIYSANNGGSISTSIPLGVPINEVNMDEFFYAGDSVILIKLSLQPYSN